MCNIPRRNRWFLIYCFLAGKLATLFKVDYYFPQQITKDTHPGKIDSGIFDSLNHHKWPKNAPEKDTFEPQSIEKLARLTNVRYTPKLQAEFNNLVKKVLSDNSFWCDQKLDDSLMLWVCVIRKYRSEMTQDLLHIILASAIVPMSSADSERSFSTMNRLKTKYRSPNQNAPQSEDFLISSLRFSTFFFFSFFFGNVTFYASRRNGKMSIIGDKLNK